MCVLCEHDPQTCKYINKSQAGYLCEFFIPNYNCNACKYACGEDLLCSRFEAKEEVASSNQKHPIESVLHNALLDIMRLEKGTEDAITKFMQFLETNGIKAALLAPRLQQYTNQLIALYVLNELITSYGLSDLRAQILSNEVNRLFVTHRMQRDEKNEVLDGNQR